MTGSVWQFSDQHLPPAIPPLPLEVAPAKSSQTGIITLLVEDNRADALIIEEVISVYGLPLQLQVIEDGAQAVEFFERIDRDPQAACPQLLLLDLNLPKRSGFEVLQCVRASAKCKDILVVIITSSDSPKDRSEAVRLGANRYFCKSASYDEFLKVGAVLKTLLEEHPI